MTETTPREGEELVSPTASPSVSLLRAFDSLSRDEQEAARERSTRIRRDGFGFGRALVDADLERAEKLADELRAAGREAPSSQLDRIASAHDAPLLARRRGYGRHYSCGSWNVHVTIEGSPNAGVRFGVQVNRAL